MSKSSDKGVASWGLPERRKMKIGKQRFDQMGWFAKKKSENISVNGVAGLNEKEKWKLKLSGMVGGDPQRKEVVRKYQRQEGHWWMMEKASDKERAEGDRPERKRKMQMMPGGRGGWFERTRN